MQTDTSFYNILSDHELAAMLMNGDSLAFTSIYKRYWKKVYVVASKRLSDQEAEEIVQDIFLNLWRKRDTFQLTTGFSNYFAIAVKFEILDVMRKRANALKYEKEFGITFSEIEETAFRQMSITELQTKLQLAVNSMPEKCQLVFRLQHEEGYSQRQISQELNISEKTVEAHLSKARKIIKGKFGKFTPVIFYII